MPRYVVTDAGIGRLADGEVELIAPGVGGLDDFLGNGGTAAELAALPARETAPLDPSQLRSPVRRPSKVWGVGWAYASHADEVGRKSEDEHPVLFLKATSSLSGPNDPIQLPALAPERVDFEGEIAVVVSREAAAIEPGEAWSHVLGLTAANDVSARDVQKGTFNGGKSDPSKAKSFDTFTPVGPCVCTPDEYEDPDDVGLRTLVDGELRQEARSSELIHSVAEVVAFASRLATLLPGDLILTGTPAGVGHPEGRFLASGSVVRIEVEGVGAIENRVA
ncbi:MAG TPA: fumarylacetoacetate hydrolase family protein [Solirubrobacterales bacterium]|jgi:2-keto-4-pentenoate hydratase/2-oxohepta-3-ene-1,7-dioic acid hydratase in catechol pathway